MQREQMENGKLLRSANALLILLIISHEVEFEQIYVFLIVKIYLPCQMNGNLVYLNNEEKKNI